MHVDAPTQFAIVGGGPAGLYMAYCLKRRMPNAVVCVYEQNTADATFGFGIVFSDQALAFLKLDDPKTAAAITPHMTTWQDMWNFTQIANSVRELAATAEELPLGLASGMETLRERIAVLQQEMR